MTRAEAWLTGIGAVLALVPGAALLAFVAIAPDARTAASYLATLALTGPALLVLAALARPTQRAFRLSLTLTSAIALFFSVVVTSVVVALPAGVVVSCAAYVTARRLRAEEVNMLWPSLSIAIVAPPLWIAAGLVLLEASRCNFDDPGYDAFVPGAAPMCGLYTGGEIVAVASMVVIPIACLAYLWRSPQPTTQL